MGGAERVVDEDVGELGQLATELGIVLGLPRLEARVLEDEHLAVAQRRDGGAPVALEIRPAGETRFATSFSRTRWPENARVTEYLTVRLADVAPDAYTLRAVADLGGGETIVTERPVDRR